MKNHTKKLILAIATVLLTQSPRANAQQQYRRVQVDSTRDLQTTIDGEFTIAAVGDVVALRPSANLKRPSVQKVYDILRNADVAFGNLEMTIAKPEGVLEHNNGHLFQGLAQPKIADDLAAMGFDLMNFANNHTTTFGLPGMYETVDNMDRVGIVTTGWGRNLAEARKAKYLDTANGRVGFLGITTHSEHDARDVGEDSPGVPGANALHTQRTITISPEAFEALRKAKKLAPQMFPDVFPITSARSFRDEGERIKVYDDYYVPGDKANYSYTFSDEEYMSYALEVRNAKYRSDFVVANIHSHDWQVPDDTRSASTETREPPDFLVELAHLAIDNGADVFYSHGEGELRGIEIYNGKPIFYQLGNFTRQPFFHEIFNPEYRKMAGRFGGKTDEMTRAEVSAAIYPPNHTREYFESIVAECKYSEGRLTQVVLHPVDLKFDGPFVDIGTPHIATGEVAKRILERVRDASADLGTKVEINGEVGVINVGASK